MRVGLFVTCLVDVMRPSIGLATLKLLEDAGCEVVVPTGQTCCGQPGYNSGAREIARDLALQVLDQFEECDYVVAPSGSCSGQVKLHYPDDLFRNQPEAPRFKALAAKWYELSQFLVEVLNVQPTAVCPGKATYHDSCAGLRELSVKSQPRQLLATVAGLQLTEMPDCEKCCGFGGSFSVKLGDISTRMAENKCANVRMAGADMLIGGDLGCLLNLEGRLRRTGDHATRVLHFAEVLAGLAPSPTKGA
jgi:L-lactate dehydrogenase complex protein LldE